VKEKGALPRGERNGSSGGAERKTGGKNSEKMCLIGNRVQEGGFEGDYEGGALGLRRDVDEWSMNDY